MMHGHEKSDPAIVAVKPANKAERSAAELVERRAGTEGNAGQQSTRRTQSRETTNARALDAFRHHVTDLWRRTLRRRSQKDRLTWARMTQLAAAWLPKPIVLHPWPSARFAVTHPRWEPYARIGPVRFCAGGAQ